MKACCPSSPLSAISGCSILPQCFTMTSSKRATKPAQVDSHQPLDTAQPSRQATTGKIRGKAKEPKKTDRDERQREEIRFNLGYSFRDTRSGASARRRQARVREDGDTSDYPPPPTYEVATSPTLSTLASSALASSTFVAGVHIHPEHLPVANRTSSSGSTQPSAAHDNVIMHTDPPISAVTATPLSMSIPAPALSPLMMPLHTPSPTLVHAPNHSSGSCAFPVPVQQKALLDDDESSIELVDVDPPQRWELDRQRGVPLEERVTRHHQRSVESHVPAVSQRTRLFSQAPKRSPTSQSRFANSRLSLRIPEDQDPYPDDRSVQASDASSPITPKHKLPLPSLPLSPSRIFHRSQSPQPSSSVISLLRNPSPFFKSTPSLLNLSSPSALHSHGDHHFSRKLFHRKQKERAGAEPLEDWEVLDRTDSSHSSLEDSPGHPSPPSPAPALSSGFAETWPYPDVFIQDTRSSTTNRHPYRPSIRTVLPAEDRPQRPASPPFVNRHVRRRTNSSLRSDHTCASSAPVSPISSSSASLFSSSSLSLATVGRTLPSFSQQDLGVCEELERSRLPTRGITLRDSPTLSSLSLSQPSVGRALASFSQMNLGTHQVQHEHVRSHSTPRAVAQPELPKTTRTHARASPTSASEVTYIDYNVTPATPVSAPNNSLPTRSATERVSRRRTPARREEILIHRGRSLSRELEMRSAPAYSAIFPSGPPTPPPESHTPPYSPAPASPRRHYAGRPLPQTPSTSPSLTWLVGQTPDPKTSTTITVLHHPRAIPKNLHVPEGLLINLDDDSLDQASPSSAGHTPPLPTHTPPLPNRTPPLPDNTPMIPDRTPPARTPSPLPIDYLEDDTDSDSITVGSSSPRGPLTPTSTTMPSSCTVISPAPEYITGLVGSLGDDHPHDDGSNYDVSIRDAQFSGPYLKSPTCAGPPPHLRFHRSCHITSQS